MARNADSDSKCQSGVESGELASSSQLVVLQESPGYENFSKPPSDKITTKSLTKNTHGTSRSAPQRRTIFQRIQISANIFKASIFAAHIPFVSADAGDDFSNNLFTDLAPVLALFGEQVIFPIGRCLYHKISLTLSACRWRSNTSVSPWAGWRI